MKKFSVALKGIVIGFAIGFGVYIVLGIVLSLIFKDNPVIYMNLPSVAVGICPFIFCIRALKEDAKKARERSYKTTSYYGSVGSTIKPQQPVQTQATRPFTPYTAPQTARTTTQAPPPAAQRPQQSTTNGSPKTASTTTAKNSSSNSNLIFQDFFTCIPGALHGLLIGFVLFVVFGLVASLTSAHSITNIFGKIAVLCLFGCTVAGYVKSLKKQPDIRKQKELTKRHIETLNESLVSSFHKLNNSNCSTAEGLRDYGDACDFLVYAISNYYFAKNQELRKLAREYHKLCHQRTYPYYAWNSRTMKYEYVVGTDLAEELMKAIRKYEEENKELIYKI